jgi:NAD(P)H-dependent nitrite reductase small subunit
LKKSVKIARVDEVPPGKGIKIKIEKTTIALFHYNGRFYAIQNNCPHQNADLADGYIREGSVYCPMHNWAFDLSSGIFAFNSEMRLKTYPVEVKNGEIHIRV